MSTTENAIARDVMSADELKVDVPTLVLAETGSLTMTSEGSELSIGEGQVAVLMRPDTYRLSSGMINTYRVGVRQGHDPAQQENYTLNIDACARAATVLERELPLCVVAGKLITLAPHGLVDGRYRNRTTIFQAEGHTISVCDVDESGGKPSNCEVLVIGAGPYGASAAVACRRAGMDTCWVGEPLSFWLRNIQPTPLRSVRTATNLYTHGNSDRFLDFCEEYGLDRAGKIQFWEFLAYYFKVILSNDLFPSHERVTDVVRDGNRWLVRLSGWGGDREVSAANVINATGIGMHPNIPSVLNGLPGSVGGHVSQFAAGAFPAGRSIAVVGGGQSAVEYAIHAAACNNVTLYVKDTLIFRNLHQPTQATYRFLASNCERYIRYLPTWLRVRVLNYLLEGTCEPESEKELNDSGVLIQENTQVSRCYLDDDGRVVVEHENGAARFDRVVAATGYSFDIRNVRYLANVLRKPGQITAGRFPRLDRNAMLRQTAPGMYFTGYSCLHALGFKSQFIGGTQLIIKRIVQDIERRR